MNRGRLSTPAAVLFSCWSHGLPAGVATILTLICKTTRRFLLPTERSCHCSSTRYLLALPALALLAASGCGAGKDPNAGDGDVFKDLADEASIDFVHFNGMSGALYFPEMMGSGVALFDYDNDGDLDVYLVQGSMLGPGKILDDALIPPAHSLPLSDRLYRNDSTMDTDKRTLKFTDVTEQAGLAVASGYGMGVAAADYDNDGFVDLYLSNFGANQLLRNVGDGTFSDVTGSAGVADARWSVSASWADFNHDGKLDLYVGNYVDFGFATHKTCRSPAGASDYCSPLVYGPQPDSLYLNAGHGRFTDASKSSGVNNKYGGALGVIAADFNLDGLVDVYVANDGVPNQLWMNQGGNTFADEAELAGVAVNMMGSPEASMGVAAADFDADGDEDLFMTHLDRETNTLFVNDGQGWFEDRTIATGLGDSSLVFTGFGTGWLDYDGDGFLDLFSANGAVTQIPEQVAAGEVLPLRQTNQLFRNNGAGVYVDLSRQAGAAFALAEVSRGAAFGDIDNDGDLDIVISNNSGRARLLVNQVGQDRPWIGLQLSAGTRDDLGARISLLRAGRPAAWGRAHSDGSYASASDPRVLFALRETDAEISVQVYWTDGSQERWSGLVPGRYHRLTRGQGTAVATGAAR